MMFILNETPVDGKYQDIVEWPGVKARMAICGNTRSSVKTRSSSTRAM